MKTVIDVKAGDIMQINPSHDDTFGGHLLIVTEPKKWGVQGYVKTFNGLAYYRCPWEGMEPVGKAIWTQDKEG